MPSLCHIEVLLQARPKVSTTLASCFITEENFRSFSTFQLPLVAPLLRHLPLQVSSSSVKAFANLLAIAQ